MAALLLFPPSKSEAEKAPSLLCCGGSFSLLLWDGNTQALGLGKYGITGAQPPINQHLAPIHLNDSTLHCDNMLQGEEVTKTHVQIPHHNGIPRSPCC